ncbi:MAG: RIP metalloprotease RseP [Planctomycetaceae bacterium]
MASLTLLALVSMQTIISVLMVAVGLGMVIFVHELGHFAVAKWCDVQVDRFSIGFGPILWSRTWGETEYALSAIPFGGYVKMLGQDDADPGQETSPDIAENPRSYPAKSVPQRMAIISAGVIMNIITGYLFYVGAMGMGIEVAENEVGFVQPGMPAWKAGMQADDTIKAINGRKVEDFADVTRGTALSRGDIRLQGEHADGSTYDVVISPDRSGTKRLIGVGPQSSPQVPPVPPEEADKIVMPGSAADLGKDGFHPGDHVKAIDGEPVNSFADLREILTRRRGEDLGFEVARQTELGSDDHTQSVQILVPAEKYRWLGLTMEIGQIAGTQTGSPAEQAGLQTKDRILKVQGPNDAEPLEIGHGVDPAALPDWFADQAGTTVKVTIEREGKGGETKTFDLTPTTARNWVQEYPPSAPMPVPAIGAAFQFVPSVLAVAPGSPADKAGIHAKDLITKAVFLPPDNWPESLTKLYGEGVSIDVGDQGWASVLWHLQSRPTWKVKLTVKSTDSEAPVDKVLQSVPHPEWYVSSDRGLVWMPALRKQKATSLTEAFQMGWAETRDSVTDIYLTLRGLIMRDISPKELHGPIGIFDIGVKVASSGFAEFLVFLGFLSVNLAVINFLPIPVLDGGHMAFLAWEGIARKRPNERVYAAAMYVGLLFILALMGWVLFLDFMRHVVS